MRRVSAWATLAMTAVGIVVMTAGPAHAQVPCTGRQTASPATITPTSVRAGETVTISGGGFASDQILGIGLFSPPAVLGTVASTVHGFYTATVQIPVGTPVGQNEITVFGVGPNNATTNGPTCHQSLALFTVTAPPVPITSPPVTILSPPVTIVVPGTLLPAPNVVTPIVVQQPLARTGSPSPALAATGLLVLLFGLHLVRVGTPRRSISG